MKKQRWSIYMAIFLTLTLLLSGCAPKASQVTTIAGGTRGFADGKGDAAQFDTPDGVAVGADGTLYVAIFPTTASAKSLRMVLSIRWSVPGRAVTRTGPPRRSKSALHPALLSMPQTYWFLPTAL